MVRKANQREDGEGASDGADKEQQKGVTGETRKQRYWTRLKIAWSNTHLPNKAMIGLTVVIIFTYIAGNYFSCRQLGITQKALEEDQRPWVKVQRIGSSDLPLITNKVMILTANLENIGKTPAFIKSQKFQSRVWDGNLPQYPPYDKPSELQNGGVFFPGDEPRMDIRVSSFTDSELRRVTMPNGSARFFFYGEIIYTFSPESKKIHTTRFCEYQLEDSVPMKFAGCGYYDYAD